jgi:hypothetical protein
MLIAAVRVDSGSQKRAGKDKWGGTGSSPAPSEA